MKDKNKLNAGYVLIDTWWNVNKKAIEDFNKTIQF